MLRSLVGSEMCIRDRSAIVVEQDISKALEISNRVYCLQEGRIALFGDSKQLTRQEISKAYFGI